MSKPKYQGYGFPFSSNFCHRFSKMVCWKVGHFNWLSNHTWRWLIIIRIDYETWSSHFSKLSAFSVQNHGLTMFNLQKVNFLSTKFRCLSSHHFWITRGPNSTVTTQAGATLRSRLHLVDLAGSERLHLGDGERRLGEEWVNPGLYRIL